MFDGACSPNDSPVSDTPRTATAAPSVAASQRARVLNMIASSLAGATDDEIQAALKIPGNTERPRRKELETAGRIRKSGTRKNAGGRACAVWVAA